MKGNEQPSELTGENYADIFDVLPCPMYIWKKVENNLILVKYNKAAEKFTQGKVANLIGIKASELHKNDPEILQDLHRCINEKIKLSKVMKYKLKSLHKEVFLHVDYFFIPNNMILVHTENRTEQKKLQEILSKSEEEKSIILNSTKELISFQDKDLKIIWANKAAAQSANIPLEKLLGKYCYEIWPKRNEPCVDCPVYKSISTGLPQKGEQKTPDDRYWSISSDPVKDEEGNIVGAVEITTEITELKRSEKKLKESEEKYREAYYRMNLYKDLFTHDINNIFQNILSSNELAMLYSNNPEKLQDYVEVANVIKDQVLRGAELVSSVKKLADLEEIEKSLYKIEIYNSLDQAIDLIKKRNVQKEIEIEIQASQRQYFINGNELLLDLFENILHKSVKDNKNPLIEILIRISREILNDKKLLKIEFIDNGVGFPNTIKDIILKNKVLQEKKTDGIGIGLLLIKRIIESYNGFIKIEDKIPGDWTKGSNFIIYIPEVV